MNMIGNIVGERASALFLRGISKSYGAVKVLREVSFAVSPGEVHALVGENGAGKSTLMGIACGVVKPDDGQVFIGPDEIVPLTPQACRDRRLAVVFQDMSLAPDLTVAQNLQLGRGNRMSKRSMNIEAWAREALDEFDIAIDPNAFVRDLSVSAQQVVEIARALTANAEVLILDEPTAALSANEVDHLYQLVKKVTDRGGAVVYITHRLPEVFALANRVSVLRDGEMVAASLPVRGLHSEELIEHMVGRSLGAVFPERLHANRRSLRLVVNDLQSGQVRNISIRGYGCEIVGLSGIEGNGQRELLRCIAGLTRWSGEIRISDRAVRSADPAATVKAGVAFVSSDRLGEALFPRLSVRENLIAGQLGAKTPVQVLSRSREIGDASRLCRELAVRAASLAQEVSALSGGNQQKIALGSAIHSSPTVFLIDEPTQGVDIGARATIYAILRHLADEGALIVALSSDADELAQLCDRVYVISRGEVVAEVASEHLNGDHLVEFAVTAKQSAHQRDARPDHNMLLERMRRSDLTPVVVLALVIIGLYGWGGIAYPGFFSTGTLANIFVAAVPLGFAALAQALLMLLGDLDLSVGPLMGLTTVAVVQVNAMQSGSDAVLWVIVCALAIGVVVGSVNGMLTQFFRISPLMATLATFILVQGVGLLWLPFQGGEIPEALTDILQPNLGPIPPPFLLLVLIACLGEFMYRRTQTGRWYRCVGSRPKAAERLGCSTRLVHMIAYGLAGVIAASAGLFFAATVGIGGATLGNDFTLKSLAAVVLGGLSTWGGRGSIIGPLLGAIALAEIATLTSFMNAGANVQFFVTGGLTLLAIAIYSRMRGDSFHDVMIR